MSVGIASLLRDPVELMTGMRLLRRPKALEAEIEVAAIPASIPDSEDGLQMLVSSIHHVV